MDNLPAWPYPSLAAHRGAGKLAPENTLAAFRVGQAHGYRMAELDAKLSADGVAFLLHDATLERTTDVEAVFPDRAKEAKGKKIWPAADFTLAEIKRLDAGSWKDAKFAGARGKDDGNSNLQRSHAKRPLTRDREAFCSPRAASLAADA